MSTGRTTDEADNSVSASTNQQSQHVERRKSKTEIAKLLFCGGVAGCVAKTVTAPFERVKILFQVNSKHYQYTGVTSTLGTIFKREGAKGLFRSNFPSVVRVFPYASIQFAAFEEYRKLIKLVCSEKYQKHPLVNLLAGSGAGATAVLFTYPLDLIRARIACQVLHKNQTPRVTPMAIKPPTPEVPVPAELSKAHYTGVFNGLVTIYKTEGGIRALFKGIGPTMLGILPYGGLNFCTYEFLKSKVIQMEYFKDRKDNLPPYVKLVCGGLAGAVGQTVTYPLDLVRRRMQMDGYIDAASHTTEHSPVMKPGGPATTGVPQPSDVEAIVSQPVESRRVRYNYKNTTSALVEICKTEGFRGLFKGLSINYIKVTPMVGVSFLTFEYMKKLLHVEGSSRE